MSNRFYPDEVEARRPGWVEGAWIVLASGQAFSFPRPRARNDPAQVGNLAWSAEGQPAPELGPEIEAVVLALPEAPTSAEVITYATGLASLLLLRNYDLDADQVRRLLEAGFVEQGDGGGVDGSAPANLRRGDTAGDGRRAAGQGITPAGGRGRDGGRGGLQLNQRPGRNGERRRLFVGTSIPKPGRSAGRPEPESTPRALGQ